MRAIGASGLPSVAALSHRLVATETDVVRRATIDARTGDLYEFRVDRATRADLGVWREPLAGGATVRVVPPLATANGIQQPLTKLMPDAPDPRIAELKPRRRVDLI